MSIYFPYLVACDPVVCIMFIFLLMNNAWTFFTNFFFVFQVSGWNTLRNLTNIQAQAKNIKPANEKANLLPQDDM